jgi:threonine dehydratase
MTAAEEVGGGALIAGVAVALKTSLPDVRVWGVETEGADAMARAPVAGEPVAITPKQCSQSTETGDLPVRSEGM